MDSRKPQLKNGRWNGRQQVRTMCVKEHFNIVGNWESIPMGPLETIQSISYSRGKDTGPFLHQFHWSRSVPTDINSLECPTFLVLGQSTILWPEKAQQWKVPRASSRKLLSYMGTMSAESRVGPQ